jgi:hypothetical protein
MVAAMRLLGWSGARWARSCVQLEILHRSFVLFSELASLGHRDAKSEFAMPALVASAAEGKGAVLADTEEVFPSSKLALATLFSI